MAKKREKIVTPVGTASYPRLNKPDTKFNPEGMYSVKLVLPAEDAQGLIDELNLIWKDHYGKTCKDEGKKKVTKAPAPWTEVEDEDGNPTGEVSFKFSLKAHVKTRDGTEFDQRPALFDAQGKPTNVNIGGGSKLKVSAEVNKWYAAAIGCGVSMWVKAVQIIDLVEYGGGTADSFGFDKEDGFTASDGGGADAFGDTEDTGDTDDDTPDF